MIINQIDSGWPSELELRIAIGLHTKEADSYKIGITGKPDERFSKYTEYDDMVLLAETTSEKQIRQMEKDLIDWFEDDYDLDNKIDGGGGPLGTPPYFLYIVLKHK